MIKILFIIPKTQQGGAEVQLLHILRTIDKKRFDVHLGTLYQSEQLADEFASIKGVKVHHFNKHGAMDIDVFFRIKKYITDRGIQIVQTLFGNHHGYIPARFCKNVKAVGGIMGTHYDDLSFASKFMIFGLARHFVNSGHLLLVSCSHAGKELYVGKGFKKDRVSVILNGFEFGRYISGNGQKIRKDFSLGKKKIIGIVGRLIETKNHKELIDAFAKVHDTAPHTALFIVGTGPRMESLVMQVHEAGLSNDVIFTGNRKDVADLLSAINVDELAQGISKLVTDTGLAESLASAAFVGLKGKYSVEMMVRSYEELYTRCVGE